MLKIVTFKERIEVIVGVQLACCIEWNVLNTDFAFNLVKLDEFNKGFGYQFYVNNQKYLTGFMKYIMVRFWPRVEQMIIQVPDKYAELTLRRCASIICASEQENDIKLLALIKDRISLDPSKCDQIINEVVTERELRDSAEKLINVWGKSSYKEPDWARRV